MRRDEDVKPATRPTHLPVVVQTRGDFQLEVLERLARAEAKMDMLVGNGQPGRVRLVENRLTALEGNDIRRGLMDRIVTASIAFGVSALIAFHDHWWPK
jgi:hypothetical protein